MRALPRVAQIYLSLVYLAGLIALFGAAFFHMPRTALPVWELSIFFLLAALAGSRKISLIRNHGYDDISLSLGFAVTFAAQLCFGPAAGVWVSVVGSLSACLYPRRQPLHQLFFNVSLSAVEAWFAGLVFLMVNGDLSLQPLRTFTAVTAASLTYFLVNTGGIAMIVGLCAGEPSGGLWRRNLLWTAPSYLAAACVSTLAMLLFDRHIGPVLVFAVPVALLTYQSFLTHTNRAAERQEHIVALEASQRHLADLYLATIKSLALAIDAKDKYTHQHILRVQKYAMAVAEELGLSGNDLEGLKTGALLHDIGKLGVPEHVLLKPGRLSDEEYAQIKKHPEIGAAILDPVDFPYPVLPVVKYHHERWDGTGYPEGLKGDQIPLTARILAVADVYDALTSDRSYRKPWTHAQAVDAIRQGAGMHFDPGVVPAFLRVIDGVVAEVAHTAPASVSAVTPKSDEAARAIRRASTELWALYEVTQTLSSSLGLDETLEILARKLEAILPGAACLFLIKDEAEEALTVRAAMGVNAPYFQDARTVSPKSRTMAVVRRRASHLGHYDSDDLMLAGGEGTPWTPLRAAMIVPIIHQGEMLGSINLYHPEAGAFSRHDLRLMETIAERAATALYNGLLFDRARSHALTDPLTGLYNLRYLTNYLEVRCEQAPKAGQPAADAGRRRITKRLVARGSSPVHEERFALLCLDLDAFKPINDNFGHQKGDLVLKDLAALFQNALRPDDLVVRYGGDEFLIILEGATPESAAETAERLRRLVEQYETGLVHERVGQIRLGASVGCACYPTDGRDCPSLLSVADREMYRDKMERKLGHLATRPGRPQDSSVPTLTLVA